MKTDILGDSSVLGIVYKSVDWGRRLIKTENNLSELYLLNIIPGSYSQFRPAEPFQGLLPSAFA